MSDQFHISEIGTMDLDHFPDWNPLQRANIQRYVNKSGQLCESYDYVDENGEVMGCGISTNIKAEE